MNSNRKITMRQLQILIILSSMGTGVIVLPHRAARFLPEGAQDGWVIAIGLTIIAMAAGALISAAARAAHRAAGKDSFIDAMKILLTKPVAYAIAAVLWVKLVFAAGLELKIFLEIAKEIMLPNTPIWVVSAVMLAACAYAAAKGVETRARVGEVLFALLILPVLFLFVVAIMDADFSNFQPVFVNDARALLYGSIRLGFILTGLECLLLVSPYVPREKSLTRAVVSALAVAGLLITAITALTIASFGRGVENVPWPVLSMMDMINLPGAFIERQEALMFGFWIVTAFALANALLFFGGLLVRDTFKRTSLRIGVIATAAAVFCVSVVPLSREEIYARIDFMYIATGAFFLVVLPVVLLIAARIATFGAKRAAKTSATVLILIFSAFALTSCWDSVEIENRAFVVAMGIDRDEENYTVILSVPVINKGEEKAENHVKSATGATITEAIKRLDAKSDKELYFGQTKLLILGTELLECPALVGGAMRTLEATLEATRRIHVLAARDPEEILEARPPGEILPGAYVADIYRDKKKIGGTAFALDFERLSQSPDAAIIPRLMRDDEELRIDGAILLKNSKKVGFLCPSKLQGLLWLFPDGNRGAVVTADETSLKITRHEVEIRFADEPLRAIIDVRAVGEIDDLADAPPVPPEAFAEEITRQITRTADVLQNKYDLDGYNLLEHLRKKNYNMYKAISDIPTGSFPPMELVLRVEVEVG